MGLTEYKRKRHFDRTAEPEGKRTGKTGWSFTVQKHAASHLHYDFRLELDGVLKSWAVPKGPSLDPTIKRLAMHVEDHPVDYGTFEGIIPAGEYGGGTVMLWDHGSWEPIGDPEQGYRSGHLKFTLHGEKLRGGWMLLRTGGRTGKKADERRWLLFKERDDEAQPESAGNIIEDAPLSVSTGRDLDEIAANKRASSKAKVKTKRTPKVKPAATKGKSRRASKLPERIDVQLATLAQEAPEGDDWLHEIKFDGYRMVARIDKGRARMLTRNHNDWTAKLSSLAKALEELPIEQAVLDGEVVVLRPDGTTGFQDLQNAFRDGRQETLSYCIFDLLYLNGTDLKPLPLKERKRLLAELLSAQSESSPLRYSDHVEGNGPAFLKQACRKKLEGIISKRADAEYQPGRGFDWLKVKCLQSAELVIGGYTEPAKARTGFGALLLGYHQADGELVYAGKTGTGFDEKMLHSLSKRLESIERDSSPFSDLARGRGLHWVEPTLVAQLNFAGWTNEGRIRQGSFQGLREDKPAAEITREVAVPLNGATKKKSQRKAAKESKDDPPPDNSDRYDARKKEFVGVRLTSPEKVLWPDIGLTKLELAAYFESMADWILPHIAGRPLVLVRCPDGRSKACFYQKHAVAGTPKNLRQIPLRESNETVHYVTADDKGGLISLAQVGALEIHAWGSREDKLDYPDRLVFDLDPDVKVPWSRVVESARQVRRFLQDLGLECFVKTTGGKGVHLVVPIERRHEWDEAKAFCKLVADSIVAADPGHYVATMSKAARAGKIFIDYLRNDRGSTAIIPYSPRARDNAPVSTPLTWKELSPTIASDKFTIRNIARRIASLKKDPWEEIGSLRQRLAEPFAALRKLAHS